MKLLGFYNETPFIYDIPDDVANKYHARVLTGDIFSFHVEKNDIVEDASSASEEYRLKKQELSSLYGMQVSDDAD